MNFKKIHIGEIIKKTVEEYQIDKVRICNFLKCSSEEVNQMFESESIDTNALLKWSKLLGYDFFRLYSQHIMLFSSMGKDKKSTNHNTTLPQFRKNIYTKEIIEFILDTINNGKMTKQQVIEKYKIPKTTLYKWISKYNIKN